MRRWGLAPGSVVAVFGRRRWVDGVPWYRVQPPEFGLLGCCRGACPVPLPATLTLTPSVAAGPATPTAFTSGPDANREIYIMEADGTGVRNLSRHPAQHSDPSWAPDRDRLASASDRSGNSDLFVIKAIGTSVTQLTFSPSDQIHPACTPSGPIE